ncbi:hypothetical protein B0T26DRAFT_876144 [Lasiosphaeria miniovina]|uniref:Uncharacterized protein n=1 Tax=Lasiosphaeria miniovina TaxID=1954250 RepID=A0AA39ZSQ6_9PEZI|nr:uncharacterized protein B0T26DRAFT_876144 [Lasiosphaeria miniovina]KAK0702944.1 hypothetical protein B0T26DRAFT_876144 [Lasiosphaeria miniovina]
MVSDQKPENYREEHPSSPAALNVSGLAISSVASTAPTTVLFRTSTRILKKKKRGPLPLMRRLRSCSRTRPCTERMLPPCVVVTNDDALPSNPRWRRYTYTRTPRLRNWRRRNGWRPRLPSQLLATPSPLPYLLPLTGPRWRPRWRPTSLLSWSRLQRNLHPSQLANRGSFLLVGCAALGVSGLPSQALWADLDFAGGILGSFLGNSIVKLVPTSSPHFHSQAT